MSGHTIAAAKPDDIPTLLGAHGSGKLYLLSFMTAIHNTSNVIKVNFECLSSSLAQLGSVELSLLYDRHSGCLHCRLLRAKVTRLV